MRALLLCCAAAIAAVAFASPTASAGAFTDSRYTETYPQAGPCDVNISPGNFSTTKLQLDASNKHVFCVQPGDYRSFGEIFLLSSGSSSSRRYLRLVQSDGLRNAGQRGNRAIFEAIRIRGSWWVIDQLTFQPRNPASWWSLSVVGGDHNILEGNLVDGIDLANTTGTTGIMIKGFEGDPANYNTVQRNLIRNGNMMRRPVDFTGVMINPAGYVGENNDFNKVLDNEIADWGDGVAVGGYREDCSEPGLQHGTVIDGNDIYITSSKRSDCATDAPDPNGECSCAENAVDVKADPGSDPAKWTRITNNRAWGFRPTSDLHRCGGSGANGQALMAGSICPGHTLVANNIITDSTTGISPAGNDWVITGNLIADTRATTDWRYGSSAISANQLGSGHRIEFNTIVNSDTAYDHASTNTLTRCNAVINDRGWMGIRPLGANHVMSYNYLYNGATTDFLGSTNVKYTSAAASRDDEYCFWRKRWSVPERICIPYGSTLAASPHVQSLAVCDPAELLSPFGLEPAAWVTSKPCADGVDNDGDGRVDSSTDVGCGSSALAPTESPECQNGLDDDGDGRIDFDGGRAANGGSALGQPDPECKAAYQRREDSGCGLGFEVGVALTLLAWRRRQIG
jgi:hypothetical protein